MAESVELAVDDGVYRRLHELPPFAALPRPLLEDIAPELMWFSVPSGHTLVRTGERTGTLYIVTSGLLGVVLSSDRGGGLVAEIHAGETVGEMSLVTDEPHSATVVSLRHSEVLAMPQALFERVIASAPEFLHFITRLVVQRLRATTYRAAVEHRHSAVALMPLDPGIEIDSLAANLVSTLSAQGSKVHLFGPSFSEQPVAWFNTIEAAHELVIYQSSPIHISLGRWARFCLRQADRIILVGRPGMALPPSVLQFASEIEGHAKPIEMLILEEDQIIPNQPAGQNFACVIHIRPAHRRDIERFARHLTERSVGLVLSGGAARAFAHIGAIRALREAGIPFDRIGGTSMGAIIAACVAAEWSDTEIKERLHASFVETNPLSDYTIPWVALFRGRKVERLLQRYFSEITIESLWRPYFCVSSNLTSGGVTVHREGLLWRALRASIALPGVLPPVVDRGEILVDGGVINTFPVDVMLGVERGPVIGVNVATDLALSPGPDEAPANPARFVKRERRQAFPGIVSILMHSGTVSSSLQVAICRTQATLLIEPPLSHVPLLDWNAFDRAIEAGYRHTSAVLERSDLHALDLVR